MPAAEGSHVLELALGVVFLSLQLFQHFIMRRQLTRELTATRNSVTHAVQSLRPAPAATDPAPLCECTHVRESHEMMYAGNGTYQLSGGCTAAGCGCPHYTEPDSTPKLRGRKVHT